MKAEKYYFEHSEDEQCYTIEHFNKLMLENKTLEMKVFEAEKEKMNDWFWCRVFQEWGDPKEGTCGGGCSEYDPRNGKSGCCTNYSNISYSAGKEITIKLLN